MKNNVLATLKYDIGAAAVSMTLLPLAGTSFGVPPGATDATGVTTGGIKTYGTPIEVLILTDRLDLSQAKYEIVYATTRTDGAGADAGAYIYTLLQRGAEGTTAQAWTASNTVYVLQVVTAGLYDNLLPVAAARAPLTAIHKLAGVMTWDGTNFVFDTIRFGNVGRGTHWSTDGYYTVAMPANGKTVKGYGGAADYVVAGGVIAIPESHALYFEPNINAANTDADVGDRFRLVANTANYTVPKHWLMIAAHVVTTAGDKSLRIATGVTMFPWIAPGAFTNGWVNFGGSQNGAGYYKDASQRVWLRGAIKTGTSGLSAFNLPAGFRPQVAAGGDIGFATIANGAAAQLYIQSTGNVVPVGSNVDFRLDGVSFIAGA